MSAYALPNLFTISTSAIGGGCGNARSVVDGGGGPHDEPRRSLDGGGGGTRQQQQQHSRVKEEVVESSETPASSSSEDIEITVKGVSVDCLGLVSAQKHRKMNNTTNTSNNTKQDRRSSRTTNHHNNDHAVSFDLRVSLNGMRYTASRSFDRFVKLHADINRECRHAKKRQRIQNSGGGNNCTGTTSTIVENDNDEDIIPDLPTNPGDKGYDRGLAVSKSSLLMNRQSGHVNGGGFTLIQNLWRGYIPVIERWLYTVYNIVPWSPSLRRFLLESVDDVKFIVNYGRQGSGSSNTLDTITEDDDEEEDYYTTKNNNNNEEEASCNGEVIHHLVVLPTDNNNNNTSTTTVSEQCKSIVQSAHLLETPGLCL